MQRSQNVRKRLVVVACTIVTIVWAYGTVQMALSLRRLTPLAQQAREDRILRRVGDFVPIVRERALDGSDITIGETSPGRSQIVFGIQSTCALCREMMPQLRAMADSLASSSSYDVVWLSLSSPDSTSAYAVEHGIRQRLFVPDERTSVLLRVRGVPTLVIIDREGRVRYRHAGRFRSALSADSVRLMAMAAREVWRRKSAPVSDSVSLTTPNQ
jgi:hypothetical protein